MRERDIPSVNNIMDLRGVVVSSTSDSCKVPEILHNNTFLRFLATLRKRGTLPAGQTAEQLAGALVTNPDLRAQVLEAAYEISFLLMARRRHASAIDTPDQDLHLFIQKTFADLEKYDLHLQAKKRMMEGFFSGREEKSLTNLESAFLKFACIPLVDCTHEQTLVQMPTLPLSIVECLMADPERRFLNAGDVALFPDDRWQNIKGIGPTKAVQIRQWVQKWKLEQCQAVETC